MAKGKVTLQIKKEKGKPRGTKTDHIAKYQFPKGVSGNPGGRPKGTGAKKISLAYEAQLEAECPQAVLDALNIDHKDGARVTWSDVLAIQQIRKAVGLVKTEAVCQTAVEELREVTEGKIPERQEVAGPNQTPLPPNYSIPIEFVDPPKQEEKK